jgi:hypothetical protein
MDRRLAGNNREHRDARQSDGQDDSRAAHGHAS